MMPFFRENYHRKDARWRRIDSDWLGSVEQVALALDNHADNTSLTLAFEREPRGPVLLFPGDAQLEDWRSWEDCHWQRTPPPAPPVTAADLLSRTVLHKVGHHGSHTATLLERGLELMTSPDLVALLPVCRDTAERMGWNMPFPALVKQLRRKTRGRLLRADAGMPDRPDEVCEAQWAAFTQRVQVPADGLYLDFTV